MGLYDGKIGRDTPGYGVTVARMLNSAGTFTYMTASFFLRQLFASIQYIQYMNLVFCDPLSGFLVQQCVVFCLSGPVTYPPLQDQHQHAGKAEAIIQGQ